jgi:peptide deformylase
MTLPIVQAGQPVLRDRAHDVPIEKIRSPEIQALIAEMIETMREAPGVGLAAPQIGVPLRVIVLEEREELLRRVPDEVRAARGRVAFGLRVFINPSLTLMGEERATFHEGCLSVKGWVALVERALEVEVTGYDEHAVMQNWRVRGWPARILQHEFDHINGTLYIDRMDTRTFAKTP